jgi:phage I-like protein
VTDRARLVRVLCSDLGPAAAETPPREFRIFKAGWNVTTKGSVLFDEQAARDVMAAYTEQGTDQIVDLEHLSLDEDAEKFRTDAKDARAHYRLELRNGELWATDVRWAPDGERRLREKTQRYISPAMFYHRETRRIVDLVNCALVSMPATHGAEALVAASRENRATAGSHAVNAATRELARLTLQRVNRK